MATKIITCPLREKRIRSQMAFMNILDFIQSALIVSLWDGTTGRITEYARIYNRRFLKKQQKRSIIKAVNPSGVS